MEFEWDPAKASVHLRKHGVAFSEAASVFGDSLAVTFPDPDHENGEARWITLGLSAVGRLLFVAHADRGGKIRIISARKALRRERKLYE